jgi:hypothetical protein
MAEERPIAADGWIHQEPLPPQYETAKTVGVGVVLALAVLLALCEMWQVGVTLLVGYGVLRLAGLGILSVANRQHNYCPQCNRRTPYDPYQQKCLCGYTPHPTRSQMAGVCLLGVLSGALLLPVGVEAQSIPVGRGEAPVEIVPQPVRPSAVYPELFGPDAVAPDVTPEFRALVNDPSWDKAVLAYQKQVLGIVHVLEGIRLFEAVKRYYEDRIAQETGITMAESPDRYYQELLKRFGYANIRTPVPPHLEKYDLFSLSAENVTRLLLQKLSQVPAAPGVTVPAAPGVSP